jgi:hypothetical protein
LLSHHLPAEHQRRVRHSDLIERIFGETCRRIKVIDRLPGEISCLTPVWAVLDRAARGWRGLTMTSEGAQVGAHDLVLAYALRVTDHASIFHHAGQAWMRTATGPASTTAQIPRRNLAIDTVAGGEAANGKAADQAGTRHHSGRVAIGAAAPRCSLFCRRQGLS